MGIRERIYKLKIHMYWKETRELNNTKGEKMLVDSRRLINDIFTSTIIV